MAGREISVKRYVAKLSAEEREPGGCDDLRRQAPAPPLTKARILLKADVSEAGEGWSDSAHEIRPGFKSTGNHPALAGKRTDALSAPRRIGPLFRRRANAIARLRALQRPVLRSRAHSRDLLAAR